jgi:hypothetical protein
MKKPSKEEEERVRNLSFYNYHGRTATSFNRRAWCRSANNKPSEEEEERVRLTALISNYHSKAVVIVG